MKSRYAIALLLIFCALNSISSQVQDVNYGIKNVPGTSYYDCYFVVSSGFAESAEDRILNDAKFSIKVETGTSISLVSSNLPFLDNEFYDGSEPMVWSVSQSVISPASDPEFDYYSFTPDLSQTSRFNDLFQNTNYNLFRISVEGSCVEGVQIFKNGIDPGPGGSGMGGKDFSNKMMINSSSSLYSGLDEGTAFGANLSLPDVYSCAGECVTLEIGGNCDLSNYTYLWSDGSTGSSITVCPDSTMEISVLVEGANGFSGQVGSTVNYIEPLIINLLQDTSCINSIFQMNIDGFPSGTWTSNDTSIATLHESTSESFAKFIGLKEGVFSINFIHAETGCTSVSQDLIVLPKLEIFALGDTTIKVGESLSFGTSELYGIGKSWFSVPSEPVTIDDGVLYGIKPGICEIGYTLSSSGVCKSDRISIVVEENNVCNDEGAKIWKNVKIGDIDSSIDFEICGSSNKFFEGEENSGILVYDKNTGSCFLNRLNATGNIVSEELAFININHNTEYNYQLELHDIDSDGLMDVFILGDNDSDPHNMSIFRNIGGGYFELEIYETWCSGESSFKIEVIDFDNDGFLDVYSFCDNEYYRIFFIDNWNVEILDGMKDPRWWVYPVDHDNDGFIDLVYQDEGILINNGDRTFTFDTTYVFDVDWIIYDIFIFDPESELLFLYNHVYKAIDLQSGVFTKCATLKTDGTNGYVSNKLKFYANINSTTEKEIVVVGQGGFMSLSTSITCDEIGDGFKYFNFGGVANKYKQIDIGNDGYTDFFYIEGNEIFASLNPNSNTNNIIKGNCFIDENDNGLFDTDETPLRNVKIETDQSDIVILTDNDGKFKLLPPAADFDLQATVSDGEWVQATLSISSEDVKIGCFESNNFGFVQAPEVEPSASVSISNSITRCDFETRFYITVENKGNEDSSFDLDFIFDDEATFMSSDIPAYTIDNNTLSANLGMLSPFLPNTYIVTLKMPSGSSNLPMLDFGAVVASDSQVLDEYNYMEQLRCSYDPNDKRVNPDRDGDDNLTLFDEDLEYTIRFQNNGNDTAFTVRIVDPLDPKIDPSSISVISSSHPVQTCIDQDTLVFLFEDIYLVDSMTNYPLSQGFVSFSCAAKDGIDENTIINNTADIIFDSNDPIITNTTINTLVSEFCTDLEYDISAMVCVGESLNGYDESGTYQDTYTDINGCDSIVNLELVVSSYMAYSDDLLVCQGDTVLINSHVITESATLIDTLESSTGCIDSISVVAVQFVDRKEIEIDVEICEGDNFEGLTLPGQYTFDLLSVQGCDSVVTVNLDVITADSEDLVVSVCEGETVTIFDIDYQFIESTEFIDTVFNVNNCPVGYTNVQVTVIDLIEISVDTIICEGQQYLNFSESGNFVIDTIDQMTGCPLIINLDLEVLPISDPSCIVNTSEEEYFQIELFPNPANDQVILKSVSEIESIQIFDTQFKLLFSKDTNSTFTKINVQEMASGIYIIKCKVNGQYLYKKLIIQ